MKVDQEVLCKFCKDYHDTSMDNCEGSKCAEMEEMYLEEHYITDIQEKTFKNLQIGDIIYYLKKEESIPYIDMNSVTRIVLADGGDRSISVEGYNFYVSANDIKKNKLKFYFLSKSDCEKALQKLCINRIIKLSKIIGTIKGD